MITRTPVPPSDADRLTVGSDELTVRVTSDVTSGALAGFMGTAVLVLGLFAAFPGALFGIALRANAEAGLNPMWHAWVAFGIAAVGVAAIAIVVWLTRRPGRRP